MRGYIFVLVAVAAVMSVQGSSLVNGPSKCCFPDQYTMYLTEANAVTPKVLPTMMLQMDFKEKKLVMVNMTSSFAAHKAANTTGRILIDYNKKLVYLVPAGHPEKCRKFPFPEKMHKCIPENATYMTSTNMGQRGQLEFDVWSIESHVIHRAAPAKSPDVIFAISRSGCVPLMEMVHVPGRGPPREDKVLVYTGFEAKVLDPSLFDLPPSCKK